jgi:hypothetical protein
MESIMILDETLNNLNTEPQLALMPFSNEYSYGGQDEGFSGNVPPIFLFDDEDDDMSGDESFDDFEDEDEDDFEDEDEDDFDEDDFDDEDEDEDEDDEDFDYEEDVDYDDFDE